MKMWKMIGSGMLVTACMFLAGAQVPEFHVPLYVATEEPIVDEFGNIISGAALQPAAERPKVMVLEVAEGAAPQPPDALTGAPVESTIPGGELSIGNLVSPALSRSGQFAASVDGSEGKQVFVRVYNAPTFEDSLFYGDSPVYTVPSGNQTLFVNVGQVTNLIRSADTDSLERGLPDVWQHLNLGPDWREIDPSETLGAQGMTVREAYIAGVSPTGTDGFVINSVRPQFAATPRTVSISWYDEQSESMRTDDVEIWDVEAHELSWWAVPDRVYSVEITTNLLTGAFTALDTNISVNTEGSYTFVHEDVPTDGTPVYYRARVRVLDLPTP